MKLTTHRYLQTHESWEKESALVTQNQPLQMKNYTLKQMQTKAKPFIAEKTISR